MDIKSIDTLGWGKHYRRSNPKDTYTDKDGKAVDTDGAYELFDSDNIKDFHPITTIEWLNTWRKVVN